ncbi:hypothetical protein GCM10017783_12030 [Deinococcus piscis]|uniref:Uncharacterized protein n=1 Tax=Deinococcus piscis TaxID=394230 RepID=A0ABQ3K3F9_9DEIO|nr:hypothetical protein GCM10017783_12030 [Deinococcus piscis]
MPDALHDTTSKRRRKATQLKGYGQGILARLTACPGSVYHVSFELKDCTDFYWDAPVRAKAQCQELLGDSPRYVFCALSRQGKAHVHVMVVLSPEEAEELRRRKVWHRQIEGLGDLERLAQYFSKPRDERACRPDTQDVMTYDQQELAQQALDACEDLLAARRIGRLPRGTFTAHLPLLKADKTLEPSPENQTEAGSSAPVVSPAVLANPQSLKASQEGCSLSSATFEPKRSYAHSPSRARGPPTLGGSCCPTPQPLP